MLKMRFKMKFAPCKMTLIAAAWLGLAVLPARADSPLTAHRPIVISGGPGGFDWMLVDADANRVFATHKGTKTVAIVDLNTDKPLSSPIVGTAQGVAVDRKDNKIFLGDDEEHKIIILDYQTLKKTGEVAVTGPVDDVLYCPKNGLVYADHDDGEDVWVINPKTLKIVGAVKIPSAPEKVEYDKATDRIYQNIKSNNTVQVINPNTNTVEKVYATAPATGPHGLAIDSKMQRLYVAGNNGKLVVMDMKTGKVTAEVDIQKGVDQIAFDAGNQRIYCACQGAISVVQATASGAKLLGNVPTPKGSHTIAVDSKTHAVWTCYFDAHDSYLLKLTP
jgi:DNA-binding beta-propeller fold protein YncE